MEVGTRIQIYSTSAYKTLHKQSIHSKLPFLARKSLPMYGDLISSCRSTLEYVFKHVPPRHNPTSHSFFPSEKVSSISRTCSLLLMDTQSMLELNACHKNKAVPTDCLCFPSVLSDLDLYPSSKAIEENCRALHHSLMSSLDHMHPRENCRKELGHEKNNVEDLSWHARSAVSDLGVVAICPSYIITRSASAIGTSRLSLKRPVRHARQLLQSCELRMKCVSIHAALHMLGYSHCEDINFDNEFEDSLMTRLERRIFQAFVRENYRCTHKK